MWLCLIMLTSAGPEKDQTPMSEKMTAQMQKRKPLQELCLMYKLARTANSEISKIFDSGYMVRSAWAKQEDIVTEKETL